MNLFSTASFLGAVSPHVISSTFCCGLGCREVGGGVGWGCWGGGGGGGVESVAEHCRKAELLWNPRRAAVGARVSLGVE